MSDSGMPNRFLSDSALPFRLCVSLLICWPAHVISMVSLVALFTHKKLRLSVPGTDNLRGLPVFLSLSVRPGLGINRSPSDGTTSNLAWLSGQSISASHGVCFLIGQPGPSASWIGGALRHVCVTYSFNLSRFGCMPVGISDLVVRHEPSRPLSQK